MNKKLSQILILAVAAIALVVTSVLGTMAFLTSSAAVANTFTVGEVFIHMYESAVKDNGEINPDIPYKNDMKPSAGNVYNLMPGNSYAKDPTIYVDAKSQSSYLFLKVRNDIRSIEEGIIQFESIEFKDGYAEVTERQSETQTATYKLVTETKDGITRILVKDGKVTEYVEGGVGKEIPLTMRAQMELKGWRFHHKNQNVIVYVYSYEPTSATTVVEFTGVAKNYAKPVGGSGQRETVDVFDRFTIRGEVTDMAIYGAARVSLVAYAVQSSGFGEVGTEASVNAAWQAIVNLYPYESGDGFSG